MKTWTYGINSLYRTASIDLQAGPWWSFALDRAVEWCCDCAPSIPLPNVNLRLRDPEDIEMNDGHQWTTRKEWYGDLSQLFHGVVHMPFFNYCQKRIRSRIVELDYDSVRNARSVVVYRKQTEKEDWVYGKGEAGGIREAR